VSTGDVVNVPWRGRVVIVSQNGRSTIRADREGAQQLRSVLLALIRGEQKTSDGKPPWATVTDPITENELRLELVPSESFEP
jgi:hypothetical protein